MTGYSSEFFQSHSQVSYQSAKAILPIVFDLVVPKSVVDWDAASRLGWRQPESSEPRTFSESMERITILAC